MIESKRMIQPGCPPKDKEIVAWIGGQAFKYWKEIISLIDQKYPGVFIPEWLMVVKNTDGPSDTKRINLSVRSYQRRDVLPSWLFSVEMRDRR